MRYLLRMGERFTGWLAPVEGVEKVNLEDRKFTGKITEVEEVVKMFVKKANGEPSADKEALITPGIRSKLFELLGFSGSELGGEFSTLKVEHTVAVTLGKNTKDKIAPRAFTLFLNPDKLGIEKNIRGEKVFNFRPLTGIETYRDLMKVINGLILLPPQEGDYRYPVKK